MPIYGNSPRGEGRQTPSARGSIPPSNISPLMFSILQKFLMKIFFCCKIFYILIQNQKIVQDFYYKKFPQFFFKKFSPEKFPGPATTKPGTGIPGTHAVNPP
jgi:hypothetical protein